MKYLNVQYNEWIYKMVMLIERSQPLPKSPDNVITFT